MTNHEGQLPNDAGEQSREAAVQAQPVAPMQVASGAPSAPSAIAPLGANGNANANVGTDAGSAASEGKSTASGTASTSGAPSRSASAKKKREAESADGALTSNNVRRIRIELMLSKAEVARRANISVLTLDRVERGYGCRVDTKRKILEALGLSLADRIRVFGEEE